MKSEQCDPVTKVDHHTTTVHSGNNFSHDDATNSGNVCDPDVNTGDNKANKPNGLINRTHKVPYIYREDVVRKNNGTMLGVVTEVAGDSESDSDTSDDDIDGNDSDEQEDNDESEGSNCDENKDANQHVDGNKTESSFLTADQVRVFWMDDNESTETMNELTVVDRGFLHGDYVAAASDPTGQVGVVVDVTISVDLLHSEGHIIKDVSSKELKRVRDFTVGDYVVLGPWLGRIDDVIDNVTVLFDDGSLCKVTRADPLHLRPVSKNLLEDGHFPYYPGQRVRASSSSVFKNSRWLSGLWKANKLEGTVTKVTVGSVFIYWIASAGHGPDSSTAPAEEQSPKNLKLLSSFTHANWQLGDWCLLPSSVLALNSSLQKRLSKLEIQDSVNNKVDAPHMDTGFDSDVSELDESHGNVESLDVDIEGTLDGNNEKYESNHSHESSSCHSSLPVSKEPPHEYRPLHRKKVRKVGVRRDKKNHKKDESFERALLIVNIRTKVDVSWQDGTVQHGLESTSLIPINSPGDHEFVPEQYVVEKASDDGAESREVLQVGVIKSVNAKERTACVRWLKPVSRAEDPRKFEKEETVSVYELEGHPDYDYCYGDVVVRLTPVSVSNLDCVEETSLQTEASQVTQPLGKEEALGDGVDLESPDLSWVGNITGLRNGDIEVTWADGMVSMVGPQAIYVVGREEDEESVAAGSAISWETVEDDKTGPLEMDSEEHEMQNASDRNAESEGEETASRSAALSLPLAALGFVSRLASGIFSRGQRKEDSNHVGSICENELQSPGEISGNRDSSDEFSSQISNLRENCDARNKKEEHFNAEARDKLETAEVLTSTRIETSNAQAFCADGNYSFKRFDTARDPLDHYFLGSGGQNNGRKWLKKVQQDWTILQNNLPEGIFVRVYEDRMDLLRAVIVGPYGTPYQDGIFFFDFHLLPEYPDVPPSVYYHSGGWRINPNLYEEGKVCLSLLNTWTGKGNEIWDPSSSSILQVLVSLQGLVLNSKPYFNEAGYDKQVGTAEGEKNSLSYNENTFLLNCKTMMYLIRRPPKDFEDLVKEHFRKRGYFILKACDAYMKGYLIGSLNKDASVSDETNANLTSVGFKLMLAKIMPKLYLALSEVGADCLEFKHLQQ